MNVSVHFSSATDLWSTPQDFYNKLDDEFHFTLDPCATEENHKTDKYFTVDNDGLVQDWSNEIVFMNPPYGRTIGDWMKKASESSATVVCLVPARTDTRWWHEYVIGKNAEVRFIKGRLKFRGSKKSAPFPSAVVVYRNRSRQSLQLDEHQGLVRLQDGDCCGEMRLTVDEAFSYEVHRDEDGITIDLNDYATDGFENYMCQSCGRGVDVVGLEVVY